MARFEEFATNFATSLTDNWLQAAYQAGRLAEIRAAAEEERRTLREQGIQQRATDTNRLLTAGEQEALLARIQGRQTRKNTRTAGAQQRATDTNRLVTAGEQLALLARVQGRQKRRTEAERQEQERLTAQFLDQLPTSSAQREQMAAQAALALAQADRTGADAETMRAALASGSGGAAGPGLFEQMIAGVDLNELLVTLLDQYRRTPQMQTVEDERRRKRQVPVPPMQSAMSDMTEMYMGIQALANELVNAGRGADEATAAAVATQEDAAAAAAQEQQVQAADPVDGRQYIFGDPATDPIAATQQTSLLQQEIARQMQQERDRRVQAFQEQFEALQANSMSPSRLFRQTMADLGPVLQRERNAYTGLWKDAGQRLLQGDMALPGSATPFMMPPLKPLRSNQWAPTREMVMQELSRRFEPLFAPTQVSSMTDAMAFQRSPFLR